MAYDSRTDRAKVTKKRRAERVRREAARKQETRLWIKELRNNTWRAA